MNKRFALCVGNNYPDTGADLNGCVNDALDWAELLQGEGYEVEVMAEARKADVVEALNALVTRAGWADRIVFQFSGHGTWVPDRSGDEADGRDEAMVMAGLSFGDLLTDDELQQIFSGLQYGTGALVLSDSCHSGTISKFNSPLSVARGKRKFISPIDLDTPLSFEKVIELEKRAASVPRRTSGLISGCADQEYSYDAVFDGRPNGAFSRVALDMFMHGITLNHWYQAIRQSLPTEHYPQTPQLITTTYRKYTRAI